MDYTMIYETIDMLHGVKNITEKYTFYYDETNNPRKFKLTDQGFNYDESAFFVLGGLVFIDEEIPSQEKLDVLFAEFNLQKNAEEIKFKHISNKSKDFLQLMSKHKVKALIDFLYANNYMLHYSFIDNFYFTIVDIVDSMEESAIGGMYFSRDLKNSLYSLIKQHKKWFMNLLIRMDYPNIKNHRRFIEEIVDWIYALDYDNFNLEYLRQSLKNYRNKSLVFLKDNVDKVAIEDYSFMYICAIVAFPYSVHIFDKEDNIECIFKKSNGLSLYEKQLQNYKFVDSKNEVFIQISDLCVGVIRMLLSFLENNSKSSIVELLDGLPNESKNTAGKLQTVLLNSLYENEGFKNGSACDDFELKINTFLEFEF